MLHEPTEEVVITTCRGGSPEGALREQRGRVREHIDKTDMSVLPEQSSDALSW